MPRLPEGEVTFLFTDVEGSTRLLELHEEAMGVALARHHEILERIVSRHSGVVFETIGDAVYGAFERAADAVAAALVSHRALAAEDWGPVNRLAVRIAIHTGPVVRRGNHYFGAALFRAARLQALGFGEQTLVSGVTADMVADGLPDGASLVSLGSHRLKDLGEPEDVFQLTHPELRIEFPPLKSIDARPHNLPLQLSSFVGRDRELSEIGALLTDHRLVTLVGEGGIGKTRLALQAAADHLDRFDSGVFFVDLAALRDPELVPGAVARALGLREQSGEPLSTTIRDYLQERSLLLVLDNLEQLLPAAASSVAEFLEDGAGLRVIATSRIPLRVRGERQYRVPPLASGHPDNFDAALPPAVQLFVERARAIDASVEVDARTGPVIADICQRLDGLPLAIELAVQRLRVFDLIQLHERLNRRLDVLSRGPHDAPARQQTLRAAIAWSEGLLAESERRLFMRLGVFVGGFTLKAGVAIAGADSSIDPADGIEALVDYSLLRRADVPGEARFVMLETIREHAVALLDASGEMEDTVGRSIEYWATEAEAFLASIMNPRLAGGRQRNGAEDALASMVRDFPNARTALLAAIRTGEQEQALRIISGISTVWIDRGPWREGVELSEATIALGELPATTLAGDVLHRAAIIAARLGDRGRARDLGHRALQIRRSIGDPNKIESTLTNLVVTAETPLEALGYIEESLEIKRRNGIEVQDSLADLAFVRLELDDVEGAEPVMREALHEAQRAGDHSIASVAEYALGRLSRHRGDNDAARSRFERSLDEARAAGELWAAAAAFAGLAECHLQEGDWGRAGERLVLAVGLVPKDEWALHPEHLHELLVAVAAAAVHRNDLEAAAEICGALAEARVSTSGLQLPYRQREMSALARSVMSAIGKERFWTAWRRGQATGPELHPELARRALPGIAAGGEEESRPMGVTRGDP